MDKKIEIPDVLSFAFRCLKELKRVMHLIPTDFQLTIIGIVFIKLQSKLGMRLNNSVFLIE